MFGKKEMVIKVDGMMCQHCATHVKEALEKVDGVKGALVNLEAHEVTITYKNEVSEDKLKAAVEAAGYQYKGLVG